MPELASSKLWRMSKTAEAYERVSSMIEFAELSPGTVLTESALMEASDSSRTPLREAVQRLVRERWLETGTGRGLRVPPISVDDQLARLEVRRSLEVLAVELACVRANAGQVAEVAEHVAALGAVADHTAYAHELRRSHELIRAIANNDYLADALAPLQGLSRRFWIATTVDRHEEIARVRALYVPTLEAVVRRDAGAARTTILDLHDHLFRSALDYAARRAEAGRVPPPSASVGPGR